MKSFVVISGLIAAVITQQLENFELDKGQTRQSIGHVVTPGGTAPEKQNLTPRFTAYHPEVKRTKVRYGPFRLPSTEEYTFTSFASGEPGTMSTVVPSMSKPCSECLLVTAQAGLEYANGTVADNSNGAWLHHVVLFTSGKNHTDGTCSTSPIGFLGERTFSSGNERTPTAFGDVIGNKVKSGFPLAPYDRFFSQLELMNLNTVVKNVYLTIDFEYVPGPRPTGFKRAHAMWLDVTNCGISSVIPPYGQQKFQLSSKKWTVGYSGQMLGVGGHLHDGGTHLEILKNGSPVCDSKAEYGIGGGHSHGRRGLTKRQGNGPSADGKAHIRTMSTCSGMGPVSPSDQISIKAYYDFDQHKGLQGKYGAFTEVMGIAIMYLAADQ